MAAFTEAGSSRKRIATYGKPIRKRLPDHITFKTFAEFEKSPGTLNAGPAAIEGINSSTSSSPSSIPPIGVEMSRIVFSDDDTPATPPKRRKVTQDTHKPSIAIQNDNLGTNRTLLRHLRGTVNSKRPNMEGSMKNVATSKGHGQWKPSKPIHSAQSTSKPKVSATAVAMRTTGAGVSKMAIQTSESSIEIAASQRSAHTAPCEAQPANAYQHGSTPATIRSLNAGAQSFNISKSPTRVLSPGGMKIWEGLLGDDNDDAPESLNGLKAHPRHERHQRLSYEHSLPRRRLIDFLVEQSKNPEPTKNLGSIADDEKPSEAIVTLVSQDLENKIMHMKASATSGLISQMTNSEDNTAGAGGQSSQIPGAKITYSRQRSMLAELNLGKDMSFEVPLQESFTRTKTHHRRGSITGLSSLDSSEGKGEAGREPVGVPIRTIHELRQAGAESRFKDEVEDLLDYIGSPEQHSSVRRLALMNLARRMKEKTFLARFLSHGVGQRLFVHFGQEQDIISGFLLVSLLIFVLDVGTTPASVTQFRSQGITRLLRRMIDHTDSIVNISKHRLHNLSKSAQAMLSEQHQNFLELRVWDGVRPQSISPRTASLRCLELIVRQSREAGCTGDIISKELMGKLFEMLKLSCDRKPLPTEAIDVRLVLSTLDAHSLNPIDFSEYLPVIKDLLELTLRAPFERPAIASLLRLVLNTTDDSPTASDIFASYEFLHLLCRAVIESFGLFSGFVAENERHALLDDLVLMLIVLINIIELSDRAHQCFLAFEDTSIDDLTVVFLENNERYLEADSVEESHLNVAGGYLAVFLGFLSLSPDIGNRIAMLQRTKSLQPLIGCIDEFISHHKRVDDLLQDDGDHKPQSTLTDRLQQLVNKLKGDGR